MTLQTMSNNTHNISVKQPARHQRFAASPLARMRHSKGFTLVELMVVIVIVGILSAVALPKFLGLKDTAKLNTQLGEASGLAKECSTAIIADGTYPADYAALSTNTGLTISGNCNNTSGGAPTTSVSYTTTAAKGNEGAKCGTNQLNTSGKTCVVKVDKTTGDITYTIPPTV